MFNPGTAMNSSVLTRVALTAAPVIAGALFLAAPSTPRAAMAPQSSADTVLPGYWEYTTSAVGIRDTETKCVRPSEINRFFGGLSTNRWKCTYPVRQVGAGRPVRSVVLWPVGRLPSTKTMSSRIGFVAVSSSTMSSTLPTGWW